MLRKEDLEIYLFRLLLEYGRVIDDGRDRIGFLGDGGEETEESDRRVPAVEQRRVGAGWDENGVLDILEESTSDDEGVLGIRDTLVIGVHFVQLKAVRSVVSHFGAISYQMPYPDQLIYLQHPCYKEGEAFR